MDGGGWGGLYIAVDVEGEHRGTGRFWVTLGVFGGDTATLLLASPPQAADAGYGFSSAHPVEIDRRPWGARTRTHTHTHTYTHTHT